MKIICEIKLLESFLTDKQLFPAQKTAGFPIHMGLFTLSTCPLKADSGRCIRQPWWRR